MKKTCILGISAFYHDSAAALVVDGEIIAAAQEERFTRKKHDPSFPKRSIEYCLKQAGITARDLEIVAFYERPSAGVSSVEKLIRKELDHKGAVIFPEHHHSHAASAFYPSPYEKAAILTIDGVGERVTTCLGKGEGNRIELHKEIRYPHSLGLFYSAFTHYCGFEVNSDEYKLMGLAPYGDSKYVHLILDNLINLKDDGSFRLNLEYFRSHSGQLLPDKRFYRLFGTQPRKPGAEIKKSYMDIARSAQAVTEMAVLNLAREAHRETGLKNLCMAGGVALNCVANGKILREGPFENLWVQPAASDAGGSLGAALIAWHEYLGRSRQVESAKDSQRASLLGPSFSDEEVEDYLIENRIPHKRIPEGKLPKVVAELVARQKVVGWFQGRMEFGPRALGSRSILGDPGSKRMKSLINNKIKFREPFRPFAPSVLFEDAPDYFGMDRESPYMLFTSQVAEEKSREIPSVTHVDRSARVQTVKREDNPLYYDMIRSLCEYNGSPVVLNTSFNVKGEPIVCTPDDAYKCFMKTDLDHLVMGSFLIDKSEQK
ncbi:MAG: carbamoyltransferase [Candidatus Omnitrophota bacterium]